MIRCSRAVSLLHQIHNIRSQVRIHVNIIDHLGQWGRRPIVWRFCYGTNDDLPLKLRRKCMDIAFFWTTPPEI